VEHIVTVTLTVTATPTVTAVPTEMCTMANVLNNSVMFMDRCFGYKLDWCCVNENSEDT
jgi:hypothetical protein